MCAGDIVISVLVEEMDVQKQPVQTGGVRVSKTVREREEIIDMPLIEEHVSVERVPINRPVAGPIPVRYEGDTMIVPLLEETLVIEKRLMLKEELHITRERAETHHPQTVTLRTEEAAVEQLDGQTQKERGT